MDQNGHQENEIGGVIAALFALAALIRLAYFNVNEEERQQQTDEKKNSIPRA